MTLQRMGWNWAWSWPGHLTSRSDESTEKARTLMQKVLQWEWLKKIWISIEGLYNWFWGWRQLCRLCPRTSLTTNCSGGGKSELTFSNESSMMIGWTNSSLGMKVGFFSRTKWQSTWWKSTGPLFLRYSPSHVQNCAKTLKFKFV
jgi:hypothetical protein